MPGEVLFVAVAWFAAVGFVSCAMLLLEEPRRPVAAAIYFVLAAVCLVVGALVAFGIQRG